jgi:hypothetical protein
MLARRISPRDPDLNFGLSNLRGSQGDYKTAFEDVDTAVANAEPAKRLALQYGSGRETATHTGAWPSEVLLRAD